MMRNDHPDKRSPSAVAAVVFDMDGTLLEWKDPAVSWSQSVLTHLDVIHQTLVERGYQPPAAELFSPAMQARAGTRWSEAMRTCRSYTVDDLLEEMLPEMSLEVAEDDLKACVAAFEALPWPNGPVDGAQSTLATLRKRRLRVGLISNTWSSAACRNQELRRAGLLDLLGVRVYSSEMEVMKPHPAIFLRALSQLDVTAAQAVMVGDILEMDIAGAQGVGMRAVWLDSRGRGLPDDTIQPDASIRQLGELPGVLDRWLES
jgi:putative hydrolase of the HAD superfamily